MFRLHCQHQLLFLPGDCSITLAFSGREPGWPFASALARSSPLLLPILAQLALLMSAALAAPACNSSNNQQQVVNRAMLQVT